MEWKKIIENCYENKIFIKIILSSGTYYSGYIVFLDDDSIQLKDIKNNLVHIKYGAILSVEETDHVH